MEWTFFILGFCTGLGSVGLIVIFLAANVAIKGHRIQREMTENAGKTMQDIMAKAGTAAMMKREGGSQH